MGYIYLEEQSVWMQGGYKSCLIIITSNIAKKFLTENKMNMILFGITEFP